MKHSTRNLTGPLAGLSCAILTALLQARGMGAQHPVASAATEEGRQQNRRVDFVTMQ